MTKGKSGAAARHLASALRMVTFVLVLACSIAAMTLAAPLAGALPEASLTIIEKSQARLQPMAKAWPEALLLR